MTFPNCFFRRVWRPERTACVRNVAQMRAQLRSVGPRCIWAWLENATVNGCLESRHRRGGQGGEIAARRQA